MTNDARGLISTRKIQSKVKIGSGDYVEAEQIGDLRGMAKQKNKKETPITLTNVKYVAQLFCNFISLTLRVQAEWKSGRNDHKESKYSVHVLSTYKEWRRRISGYSNRNMGCRNSRRMKVMFSCNTRASLHTHYEYDCKIFRHKYNASQRNMQKLHERKATSRKRHKKVEFTAENPGDQVYFDISSIQCKSLGGSKFWLLFIDQHTGYKKIYFLSLKSQMAHKGSEYIHSMEMYNIKIASLRCNNAGENIKFEKNLVQNRKNINLEFLAPNTPQQNGTVERAFDTLYG